MDGCFELQYVEGHERKTHSIQTMDRTVAKRKATKFLGGRTLISLEFRPTGPTGSVAKPKPEFIPAYDAN